MLLKRLVIVGVIIIVIGAVCRYSIRSLSTPAPPPPIQFTGYVYSDHPCDVRITFKAIPLFDKRIRFTHKVGPEARDVTVKIDSAYVHIYNGAQELVRQSYQGADQAFLVLFNIKGETNKFWTLRKTDQMPNTLGISIQSDIKPVRTYYKTRMQ